jgi:transcription antitermination protein NusB
VGVRRRGRELALQILYQQEMSGAGSEAIFAAFDDLRDAPDQARDFAITLVRGVAERRAEIDQALESQADNWRLERMAVVDRNVLRLALYELLFEKDTPPAVVIDEAIEIAKRFGSERSGQFINGVLDGVLHRTAPPAEA